MSERDTGLKSFMGRSLVLSEEQGSIIQKDDMAGFVAQLARASLELGDLESGIRDRKKHIHHSVDSLKVTKIGAIFKILGLTGEILRDNK